AAPRLAGPVPMPRAVQPEMGPQLQAAVELDEQVLAGGIDGIDLLAHDPRDLRPRKPGARRRHDPAGKVGPEGDGDAGEGISFRHVLSDHRSRAIFPHDEPAIALDEARPEESVVP